MFGHGVARRQRINKAPCPPSPLPPLECILQLKLHLLCKRDYDLQRRTSRLSATKDEYVTALNILLLTQIDPCERQTLLLRQRHLNLQRVPPEHADDLGPPRYLKDGPRQSGISCMAYSIIELSASWFGHVMRRDDDDVSKKVISLNVDGYKGRGRPKKDMRRKGVDLDMTADKDVWRTLIRDKGRLMMNKES
ncbi:hypothetical protein RR46_06606 [Papilio xuthus]|uniref:Uncharacterized protein n=1 Tax=Papilio xuthus TaxID=66420 RepID=A0A194PSQ3_PAPXU|nr:hypothetical protein RR46_06606 [Papilio xuthus]